MKTFQQLNEALGRKYEITATFSDGTDSEIVTAESDIKAIISFLNQLELKQKTYGVYHPIKKVEINRIDKPPQITGSQIRPGKEGTYMR